MGEHTERAVVEDAGGGLIHLCIDRDAERYPPTGAEVTVTWQQPPTPISVLRFEVEVEVYEGGPLDWHSGLPTPRHVEDWLQQVICVQPPKLLKPTLRASHGAS